MAFWLALLGLACTSDTESGTTDTGTTETGRDSGTTDTEDTEDTEDTAPPCEVAVVATEPDSDDDGHFWRDPLRVWFDAAFPEDTSPVFTLAAVADGSPLALAETWDESGLAVALSAPPLAPSTSYELAIDACAQSWSVVFSTSAYGEPVTGGPQSLLDRSWVVPLAEVPWTRPESAADLLTVVLTEPLLIGVHAVDGDQLHMLAAVGRFSDLDGFLQRPNEPTWDVEGVDLSQGAWFEGQAEQIVFTYSEAEVPVHDFTLSGTFAPDGAAIEGGLIEGLVDTRDIAKLFQRDDPDFVCTVVAEDYQFECTACPDGEVLCLDLKGEGIQADEVEGLTLIRNADDDG